MHAPARTDETGPGAVLYPAIAEAAHRAAATAIGLIDVGSALNLHVDRVGITYSNGQSLGDPSAAVQLSATVVGDRPIPERTMPDVVARIGIDRKPLDVTGADDARRLRAGLPLLLSGDPVDVLPDAFARVPADALPVVITTWALSRFPHERRLRFLHRLDDAAGDRPLAWVSAEGVGVAPAIPTLGDRRAFGHSTIGIALFDRSSMRTEAVGRCWSRGRWLAWLADTG
jgi:hypothetical protein